MKIGRVYSRFYGGIKNGSSLLKTQLLAIFISILLALLYIYTNKGILEDGRYISRNDYGQGSSEYTVFAEGGSFGKAELSLTVSEKAYTQEELTKSFESLAGELPAVICPDDKSLDAVSSDLYLPKSIEGYEGIRLNWYPDDPDIISYKGEVMNDELTFPVETGLNLVMKYGDISEEYFYKLCIVPPAYTEAEAELIQLREMIEDADKRDPYSDDIELPLSLDGKEIIYSTRIDMTPILIVLLGVLAAWLFYMKPIEERKISEKNRKDRLLRDYSEMVSGMLLYIGAGLTAKNAWIRICRDHESVYGKDSFSESPMMEEMFRTMNEMEGGIGEGKAYSDFAKRCDLRCYQRFSSLLEQNRKNGDRNLRNILKLEMEEAFDQRKNRALRCGHEASVKLMLPLFLSFGAVILIVIAPAVMSVG